MDWSCERVVKM